jgi:major membrane immunogen (membrane-anchored lipoprotein)
MKRAVLATAIAATLLSGCGSSDSSGDPAVKPGTNRSTPDPATLAGACDILVGEGRAVQEALGFPRKNESSADEALRFEIQEQLFSVVVANNKDLADPAGQLVDFLDDPEAYIENGELAPIVLRAFSDIRETCEGQPN